MASERGREEPLIWSGLVLILVLVEDGFRVFVAYYNVGIFGKVLILVLVEDGFREFEMTSFNKDFPVLILVLVEDGFRAEYTSSPMVTRSSRLNPCSCGRWLQSFEKTEFGKLVDKSLNPCSCGRWLQSDWYRMSSEDSYVS